MLDHLNHALVLLEYLPQKPEAKRERLQRRKAEDC